MAEFTLEEASTILEDYKVPCGRVNDLKSMFEGKTAKELKLVEKIGTKQFIRSPIRTDKDNMAKLTEPPKLNQQGHELMR